MAYALQKLFKEVLEHLQKFDIITPLGVDELTEWCNNFVLVPKSNGKVRLCLDLVMLNQVLIRPIHRGPILNDILPKLNNVKYMSIIGVSLGYHNIQLDTKSSYLITFACPFGRYQYKHLLFGAVPACDMFQHKIDEIFNDTLNIFGIADNILVIGYNKDGADHNAAVHKVLRQCREVMVSHWNKSSEFILLTFTTFVPRPKKVKKFFLKFSDTILIPPRPLKFAAI